MNNKGVQLQLLSMLTVVTAGCVLAIPSAEAFYDVSGNWAESSINTLSQQGIITGYPNGEFKPNGLLTRAEFATVLSKALDNRNDVPQSNRLSSGFTDVHETFWANAAINMAAQRQLMSGYPGGYFYPTRSISRAEVLTVIAKAANAPLLSLNEARQVLSRYEDGRSVPEWAITPIASAIKANLYVPPASQQNRLRMDEAATRADVAAYTDRLLVSRAGRNASYQTAQNTSNDSNTPNTGLQNLDSMAPEPQYSTRIEQQNAYANAQLGTTIIPANTVFTAVLSTPVSTERSRVGDAVNVMLDKPVMASNGVQVAPAGSQLRGSITEIDKAQMGRQNAGLMLNFNQLVLPTQQTLQVVAEVNTKSGMLDAATLTNTLLRAGGKTLAGAVIGSGSGAILGAIKGGGKTDDYLAQGAVIGASAGAVAAGIDKGKDIILMPGDTLELRFRQPVIVPSSNNN